VTTSHLRLHTDQSWNPDSVTRIYDRRARLQIQELFPDATCATATALRLRYQRLQLPASPITVESEGRSSLDRQSDVIKNSHTFKTAPFFNMNRNGQQPAWTDSIALTSVRALTTRTTRAHFRNMLLGNYTSATQATANFRRLPLLRLEFFGRTVWKVNRRLTLGIRRALRYLGRPSRPRLYRTTFSRTGTTAKA